MRAGESCRISSIQRWNFKTRVKVVCETRKGVWRKDRYELEEF